MADLGPAVIGLIGVGVGSAFSVVGSYLGVRANATAAREQREDEDRRARDAYQVETLQELQMAFERLMRAAGAILSAELEQFGRTGHPPGQIVSEPLNSEALRASFVVRLLIVRVREDQLRETLELAHEVMSKTWRSQSDSDVVSRIRMGEASIHFSRAQHVIGEALRNLPAPGSYRPLITAPTVDETPGRSSASPQ